MGMLQILTDRRSSHCPGHLLASLLSVVILSSIAHAEQSLLVPATIDGKASTIYEKVVVTSPKAQLRPAAGGEGTFIEPFAIFYRLKTDDGQLESNGHWRVGDSQGQPLGWIKKEDVVSWNTRFVLEPLEPTPDRTFTVNLVEGSVAKLQIVPGGKRRFAFVTAAAIKAAEGEDENGPFPVVVCTAEVRSEGQRSMTDELNDLKELKLEVVFVMEATDFMLAEYSGQQLKDFMVILAQELAKATESEPQLAKAGIVRFGLVEYQDTSKKAEYPARVALPLTDDMQQFTAALKRLNAIEIGGDWPEDVLAGLEKARNSAGWSKNSVKHVIHVGRASMQLDPRGKGINQFGGNWNSLTAIFERSNPEADCGWNSTGLTVERLLQLANPEGGSIDERARNQINFHSLWIGKNVEQQLRDEVPNIKDPAGLIKLGMSAVRMNDELLSAVMDKLATQLSISEDGAFKLLLQLMLLGLAQDQQVLAQTQYKELTLNRGIEGYFKVVPPDGVEIRKAAKDLLQKLKDTLSAAAKIRSGEIAKPEQLESSGGNQIAQRYYVIVGAAAERLKDSPVQTGTAPIRDERGRLVAQKKVLVTQDEIRRLRSTFDAIHKTFQGMTAKVDRQDVSKILENLKRAIASTAAGQKIDESVPLKALITDLPLKTNALDVTPGDIAVMSSDAFEQWLSKVAASIVRMDDLLAGKAEWMALNEKAENDKFTFLHLSELP